MPDIWQFTLLASDRFDRYFSLCIRIDDFRLIFTRFQRGNEKDELKLIAKSLEVKTFERTSEDIQRIANWLEANDVLPGLCIKRYLELSKTVSFEDHHLNTTLCNQGDVGDAFYIIFSGEVSVHVDGQQVHVLKAGEGFGERSLENDEVRSATCRTNQRSRLIVIRAREYQKLLKAHQNRKISEAMDFLQSNCNIVCHWPYTKAFRLSGLLKRREFKKGNTIMVQGDESIALYLLYKGSAQAQKEIVQTSENRWPSSKQKYRVLSHSRKIAIFMETFLPGSIFGEEVLFGQNSRSQYTTVATEETEVFVVNKTDAQKYFRRDKKHMFARLNKALHMTPDTLQVNYFNKKKTDRLFSLIKSEAFGKKYQERINCHYLGQNGKRESPTRKDRSKKAAQTDGKSESELSVASPVSSPQHPIIEPCQDPVVVQKTCSRRETSTRKIVLPGKTDRMLMVKQHTIAHVL